MAFYDYIPLAGSIARLAQGNYKQAGIDVLGPIGPGGQQVGNDFSQSDFMGEQAKHQGYEQAQRDLDALSQKQKDFQMQGLQQAEGYYQPAAQRINQIYGSPGSFRK